MKEIIEAIIAASMGSDIINKAKKEFHIRFINGELNKELLKDIESINVKSLNQLLEDILDGEYSIEDKIKAVEQWDNVMVSYIKYISDMRDGAKESYDKLLEDIIDGKYSIEASKAPIYSVFYCSEVNLIFCDNNNKLRSSFKGNIKTLYSGNDEDKARITCDEFIRNNPKFYFVDYKQIYKE